MSKTDQSAPSGNSVYEIINVRFADLPNTYNYNRNQLNLRNGDVVVAETDRGDGVGTVVIDAVEPCCNAPLDSLKRVLRKATPKDIERERERKELERKAYQLCVEKAGGFRLEMNLVTVQYFFDRSKAIFYFTADGRIDFRELVKSLAKSLNTRIEMRQIGVRDKARLVGGIGCCGRELCCQSFLRGFRAGFCPHGQGSEPSPEPLEDLRSLWPPDVLPDLRACHLQEDEQGPSEVREEGTRWLGKRQGDPAEPLGGDGRGRTGERQGGRGGTSRDQE